MSVVQNGITKEIQSLKDSKLNANDAISALSKLTEEAKKLAEENVEVTYDQFAFPNFKFKRT